jgi:uncharacterized lipoprotein YmbA
VRRVACAVAVAVAVMSAGGCASSPPLHYYTLTDVPATNRLTSSDNAVPVRLDRVTIPTELDRSQLVRRTDATRLQIIEGERWAAPLDDTIRRVLSDDLAARLPPNMVASPYEPSIGEKRQSLSVDIEEFYGDATCAVTLRASWLLKQPDMQSSRGTEQTLVPANGHCDGSGALPGLMSQALAQLSDRIAEAIAHPQRPAG